jgi:hypothetical protein
MEQQWNDIHGKTEQLGEKAVPVPLSEYNFNFAIF